MKKLIALFLLFTQVAQASFSGGHFTSDQASPATTGTGSTFVLSAGPTLSGTTTFPGSTVINSSGLIGVGMTPSVPLDIAAATAIMRAESTTGTNGVQLRMTNTGSPSSMYFGLEDSVGGSVFTGTSAYSLYWGTGASRSLHLITGGAVRATIASGGQVTIGGTNTTGNFNITNSADSNQGGWFSFPDSSTLSFKTSRLGAGNTQSLRLEGQDNVSLYTNALERAKVTVAGRFLVGTTGTAPDVAHEIDNGSTTNTTMLLYNQSNSTSSDAVPALTIYKGSTTSTNAQIFQKYYSNAGGTNEGFIGAGAGGSHLPLFISGSDRRIKKNIQPLSSLEKINQLNPVHWDWKDGSGHSDGFVAQEMIDVFPEMVSKTDDGKGDVLPSGTKPWLVGYGALVPHLVSAVKELTAKNTALESRVKSLEERLTALESK